MWRSCARRSPPGRLPGHCAPLRGRRERGGDRQALWPVPEGSVVATEGGDRPGGRAPQGAARPDRGRSCTGCAPTPSFCTTFTGSIPQTPLEQTLEVIASYRERGEIRHVGLTEVGVEQIERAWRVVPVAAVQTHYNRDERRTRRSSTTVPRRGSLRPLLPAARAGPPAVAEIAARHGANTTQIALAWLLRLSPTMLPIPSALSLRTYGPTSQELQLGAGRPALLVNGYPRPRRTGTRCFPAGLAGHR